MTGTRNVLVTGAGGFVGRRVVHALTERGFRVTGMDLPRAALDPARSAAKVRMVACDLLDETALSAVADSERYDAVVHLAGVLPGQATLREMFAVNVGTTAAVLERLAARGCHVVLFSTARVYGNQAGPFKESLACLPCDRYTRSKLAAETLVMAWQRETGSPVTVLRPSVLYGSGAPASMLLTSLIGALRSATPFDMTAGEQMRDFLHVDDAAAAVAAVIEQRAAGVWNLASDQACSVRQAAELAASIAGRPDLLRVGALPYGASEVFDYRVDASALRRAVHWKPQIDLAAGLERLWQESSS